MKFIVVGVLLAGLCGCAAKPFVIPDASPYALPGSAFNGQATVYVVRDLSSAGRAWPVDVKLDGLQKGSLRRGTYIRFAVAPGQHDIEGHRNILSGLPDTAVSSAFEGGKTYYFVIDTTVFGNMQFSSAIGIVKPAIGAELVRAYKDRTPGIGK